MTAQRAHGLTWDLPLRLAEWRESGGPADVVVSEATVPPVPEGASWAGPLRAVRDGAVWFDFPGVARGRVSGGMVTLERAVDGPDDALAMFLSRPLAAVVLHQRGALPLSASALALDGRGALITGIPGVGASSLLAAMVGAGADPVGDGLAAVWAGGGAPTVAPGSTAVLLSRDAVESLGWGVEGCARVRDGLERFMVPLPRPVTSEVPVTTVYLLRRWNQSQVELTEVRQGERIGVLLEHTCQAMTVKRMGRHGSHFALAAALAAGARMVEVRRRQDAAIGDRELVDRVLEDLAR